MTRRLRCGDRIDMMMGGDAREIDKVVEKVSHLSGIQTSRNDDLERWYMIRYKQD